MGFAGMAALTHEMEDVFELLRQRKGGLPRAAIDVLLECLDALSAAVDAIDESGEEQIDPDAADRPPARALVRERDVEARGGRTTAAERADRPGRDGRRAPRRADQRDAVRRRPDPVGARLHGAVRARRARRDARLQRPRPTRSRPSTAARSTSGWSPSAPTPSSPRSSARSPTSITSRSSRPVSDAAVETGDEAVEAAPKREAAARAEGERLVDRPRRRRAARPADALHGRARPAPHPGRGARRRRRRAGPLAGDAGPDAHARTRSRRWSCRSG